MRELPRSGSYLVSRRRHLSSSDSLLALFLLRAWLSNVKYRGIGDRIRCTQPHNLSFDRRSLARAHDNKSVRTLTIFFWFRIVGQRQQERGACAVSRTEQCLCASKHRDRHLLQSRLATSSLLLLAQQPPILSCVYKRSKSSASSVIFACPALKGKGQGHNFFSEIGLLFF